jgi:nucleoside-diphosphate-sugar epimerase
MLADVMESVEYERRRRIFVTGGTGHIGSHIIGRLLDCPEIQDVNCLVRPGRRRQCLPESPRLRFTTGDVTDPDSYADELKHCDVVVHLAAVTGIAPREECWRVNHEGTAALVDASQQAGVGYFVFVSSIAAAYPDKWCYDYAQSKAAAEAKVIDSPLRATVIRPTIVTGRDAAVTRGLARLRKGPLLILFGSGNVKVQPIDVCDLARQICRVIVEQPSDDVIEVGGADVLTLRRFIELLTSERDSSLIPILLPVRPLRVLLAALRPVMGHRLPLTAGQLALFLNNSTAESKNVRCSGEFVHLDELVARCRV